MPHCLYHQAAMTRNTTGAATATGLVLPAAADKRTTTARSDPTPMITLPITRRVREFVGGGATSGRSSSAMTASVFPILRRPRADPLVGATLPPCGTARSRCSPSGAEYPPPPLGPLPPPPTPPPNPY